MANSRPLALVTGASAGIGAVYARRLAENGYDLLLVARRRERLEALATELQSKLAVRVEVLTADLARDADLKAVEDRIASAQNLEFLLNNAGFGASGRFWEAPVETQDSMHRLHVLATVRLTHAALKRLTARGRGAVVNVSSVAAFICRAGNTSYYSTKLWMNGFSEGLYLELKDARSPVRVQALCPGYTLTEFHDVMGFDRGRVPRSWWISAEQVVDASLAGLRRGSLFVVPGWRYKLLVILLRLMPRFVKHAAATLGPAGSRRDAGARG
jgi:short-subunit dehydrogenase